MLNKCMIIGRLGADPEMRYTANGKAVTNFNVATNNYHTNTQGERVEETEWFSVVTWDRLAETCAQYLEKGRQVYVEGRMQTRSWEDKDNQKRYKTDLVAATVQFLGNRNEQSVETFTPGMPVGADTVGDLDPDDLPF
jgi:single-strand DNA-binding protein